MKEIKPRLILTDRKQRSGIGSFWHFVIILVTFCLGLYVGIRVGDLDLSGGVQREAHREQNAVPGDEISIHRGGEAHLIEEETVSVQEGSSTDVGESIVGRPSEGVGVEDKFDGGVNERERLELATTGHESGNYTGETGMFAVQVGAFTKIETANKALTELKSRGYEPYILPSVSSFGTNWYLVRIGQFHTREEAREYANSFQRTEGMEAIVEKIE